MSRKSLIRYLSTMLVSLILKFTSLPAQHFNFSQYNYTPLKINQGIVASDNMAKASLSFRNQHTATDLAFKSNFLSFSYPLISRQTKLRWGGIGISALDDRAIGAGQFMNQNISIDLAYNLRIKSNMQIGLGLQTSFNSQRFSTNGIETGSQYSSGRYDPTLQSGENLRELNANNLSFSSGFFIYDPDKEGRNRYYAGLSVFDFNRPSMSVSGEKERTPSIVILTAGYRMYKNRKIDLTPELLFTSVSRIYMLNIGGVVSFNLKNIVEAKSGRLDLSARYATTRTGIIALQFNKPKYFMGFSYDVSMSARNNPNQNATELVFGLKKTIKPKKKSKKKKHKSKDQNQEPPATARKVVAKKNSAIPLQQKAIQNPDRQISDPIVDVEETTKEESRKGMLKVHAALKHFEFEFNSTRINHASKAYLDELATFLTMNADVKVKITGHTDNVGSTHINLRISEKRALIVKKYLEQKGIEESRILAEGKGEAAPLYPNDTELERAKNRRVEFDFVRE